MSWHLLKTDVIGINNIDLCNSIIKIEMAMISQICYIS